MCCHQWQSGGGSWETHSWRASSEYDGQVRLGCPAGTRRLPFSSVSAAPFSSCFVSMQGRDVVINTTVLLGSAVSWRVAGLHSSLFVEMPNLDAVTDLASKPELSDLGSTDSQCKGLGLIAKVDTSSKQLLMDHSLPRGSFLKERPTSTCHWKQPGVYPTHAQESAMKAFLADWNLPDCLHSQGTEVGTHSVKFICPSMDVSFRLRWFISARLSVVHRGSRGGEAQCGGEMNLSLALTSCNDGALTPENGLYQHFADHLVTAFVNCKKKFCPFYLGWDLGGGEEWNLPWGIKNMDNEIEQTAERLTPAACCIYYYWP